MPQLGMAAYPIALGPCPAALWKLVSNWEEASSTILHFPTREGRGHLSPVVHSRLWPHGLRLTLTGPRPQSLATASLPPGKGVNNHPLGKSTSLPLFSTYRHMGGAEEWGSSIKASSSSLAL